MVPVTHQSLQNQLSAEGYVASDDLAVALHLALSLGRPLLLEGAAGVGKTDVARCLAAARDAELIRLQCYEGLDAAQAIYEWNYQRQLLTIRAAAEDGQTGAAVEARIFSRDFLLERPLLAAITRDTPPVLLIDEIDRADEEFEAYLLEILSEFQVSIPELGTITATKRPIVILTSNGTRDLSDALRRRCLYTYVPYPDRETELAILTARVPQIEAHLARQVIGFVQKLREEELEKTPGIAEMLDFAAALMGLGIADLTNSTAVLQSTLTTLLKTQTDQAAITPEVTARIAGRAA
ncbi:MAG: MoxR family ATPase [Pseudomonadota bacterium]